MRHYTEETRPQNAECYDCKLPYNDPGWVDVLVENRVWKQITPDPCEEGGILCFTCIARRCVELGLMDVKVTIASDPFTFVLYDEFKP